MAPLSGFNVRATINGAAFSIAEYQIERMQDPVGVDNSEGHVGNPDLDLAYPGFKSNAPNLKGARVTVRQASYNPAHNPFQAPFNLADDDYIALEIFPDGADGNFHQFSNLLISNVRAEGQVGAAQPVSFDGVADGQFLLDVPA